MAALKEHIKIFIVQRLACFDTPTEVAHDVKEEFGIEIDRSHVGNYDPTTWKGRELGGKLKAMFYETREKFLADIDQIPMANKTVRVRELSKLFYNARKSKNAVLAAALTEQIAKEVGGLYTNKIQHGVDKENPLVSWVHYIGGTSIPVVQDIQEGELIVPAIENKPKWRKS